MSPAAGGHAAAASFDPAPAPTAAIGAPPQQPENPRDPALQADGADPGNAAARKPAWNVPPPPPAPVGGGIMGGDESWPALTESAAAALAWPKSASSDSLSDGSAPSAPEDLVVPSVPSQPVSNPISTAPSPASTSPPPPPNATTAAPSPQNGGPSQPDLVRHGGGHGGNNGGGGHGGNNGGGGHGGNNGGADHGGNGGGGSGGNGSTRSRSTGNNSSDGNSSSGGDGNWNDGGLGGGSNMNSSVHSGGIGGSGIDSSRRVFGSNNWNGNGRGGGGYNNGSGDEGNRNNGGGRGSHWNNNGRSGSGSSNGFGGRGGRNRRDHDRGGNFSPRNYSRALPQQQQQQQQPSFYQPGPFQRPPPPPPAAHFMMPQPYVPYAPPFAYPGDVQNYPFYVTPLEQQFQNMHLIQQPMQPLGAQQDQPSLQQNIQHQIEHYFSTNNLCHDTHLRGRMDDQGWVPIDLIASFPKVTRFLMLGVDTNYILDSLQGSELVEVQGNNIRRRNDWAAWLLHRRPPPSN